MLIEETKGIKSTAKEFRRFGVTMAIALAVIGGLMVWRHKNYYWYVFLFSVLFLFLGLFLPGVLKPVHKLWMTLAAIMGWFMSRLILMILFYLMLTPIGFVMRILGRDVLNIEFTRNSSESYWIPKRTDNAQKRNYEKQF